jgi:hypothetical protein
MLFTVIAINIEWNYLYNSKFTYPGRKLLSGIAELPFAPSACGAVPDYGLGLDVGLQIALRGRYTTF